jgi:hypothetical protein
VSIVIMLAAFGRLLVNDSVAPFLLDGRSPALVASIAGGAAALACLLYADRAGRPGLKEYVIVIALAAGMTAGEIAHRTLE